MDTTIDNTEGLEDAKLMDGIVHRFPESLDKLYRRYRTVLKSVIMQVLHDDTESDDVLQEVFLQVWDRAAAYSSEKGKLLNWLCTLARRRAIDRVRHDSAYRRATDRYEVSCLLTEPETSEVQSVESRVYHDELRNLLDRHLCTLPAKQKQVIQLAFYENRSQREISALIQVPLGTVKTRIELGVKKLTQAFSGLREMV